MTGYTVHTGTSDDFVVGWDNIFSNSAAKKQTSGKKKSAAKKKSGGKKKPAAKKKTAGKK